MNVYIDRKTGERERERARKERLSKDPSSILEGITYGHRSRHDPT